MSQTLSTFLSTDIEPNSTYFEEYCKYLPTNRDAYFKGNPQIRIMNCNGQIILDTTLLLKNQHDHNRMIDLAIASVMLKKGSTELCNIHNLLRESSAESKYSSCQINQSGDGLNHEQVQEFIEQIRRNCTKSTAEEILKILYICYKKREPFSMVYLDKNNANKNKLRTLGVIRLEPNEQGLEAKIFYDSLWTRWSGE